MPFLARVYSATGLSLRDSAVFILSMKKTFLAVFILCAARALLFAVPENITDLAAIATTVEGSVTLQWTSPDPGDNTGVPSGYAVRYATSDITSANFYDGWVNAYAHNWTVFASSGLPETRTLTGLTCGATLYFAVVCIDSNTVYGVWQSSSDTGGAVNTLNFAVVALIVWFLILKPLAKKMEERRKIIDDSLDQAREIETRHALSREQYQTAVAEAKAEANRIVASAHDEAAALAGQMKGETKKEIDVLVSQAKKNIELDRQNMQQEVKKEIVDVVIAAVEKILEEKLDEKEDRKLVEGALKSIK